MERSVQDEKARVRAELRRVRARHGPAADAGAVVRRLVRLPELAAVRVVAGYAATPEEIDVDAALRDLLDRAVTVCLPWVDGATLRLAAVADLEADLAPGWRGLREPVDRTRTVRPGRLDAVLAPGLGFDPQGRRLGHGGGHFDRLIGQLRRGVPVIGVALDEQVLDAVPAEAHDRVVDVIVTPTRTLRPTNPSRL